jgi:hypothetical protein
VRRTTPLSTTGRDGTSQRDRRLPALDPDSVVIDERGHAELLAFARDLAGQLHFFTADDADDAPRDDGTWRPLFDHPDVTIADMVAYMADPQRVREDRARWLGRPQFALLLAFLELLARARGQLNGLTRRHLDHYYREVLRLGLAAPVPDRVVVLPRLTTRATAARLPAGSEFHAGRDSRGAPRIYRSERELIVHRTRIDGLRAVHVHRTITGIPDVRKANGASGLEIFEQMLSIALGDPGPGDPVPPWNGAPVDIRPRSPASARCSASPPITCTCNTTSCAR